MGKNVTFGGCHTLWIIVLFDLPAITKTERKEYTQFRKFLFKDGFVMMQYSVYMRHCASEENAQVHTKRIRASLPPYGEVRIVKITDKQFGKIEVFHGKKRQKNNSPPAQLEFF